MSTFSRKFEIYFNLVAAEILNFLCQILETFSKSMLFMGFSRCLLNSLNFDS